MYASDGAGTPEGPTRGTPAEPPQRPQLDDRGRLQETEPYAALSYWLLPAASVLVLLVGGGLGVLALASGEIGGGIAWLAIAIVLAISCWAGFVQARRARRSDRMRGARGR